MPIPPRWEHALRTAAIAGQGKEIISVRAYKDTGRVLGVCACSTQRCCNFFVLKSEVHIMWACPSARPAALVAVSFTLPAFCFCLLENKTLLLPRDFSY